MLFRLPKFSELSEDARKQWEGSGSDDYREAIQSCANCPYWECPRPTDREDYLYNMCLTGKFLDYTDRDFVLTKFDSWCPSYGGSSKVENIAWKEAWEIISKENSRNSVDKQNET